MDKQSSPFTRSQSSSAISAPTSPTVRNTRRLKACLIAPTFSPSSSGGKEEEVTKPSKSSLGRSSSFHKSSSSSSASTSTSTTTFTASNNNNNGYSFIDNAIRRAYKKVRAERDAKRTALVRNVLKESRDGVIDSILLSKSRDGEQKSSNGSTGGKKRKSSSSSPRRKKKSNRKTSTSADDDSGTHVNNDESNHPSALSSDPLVFPRLPSNGCPAYEMFLPPQEGTTASAEISNGTSNGNDGSENNDSSNNDNLPSKPNNGNNDSNNNGNKEPYTLTIKYKSKPNPTSSSTTNSSSKQTYTSTSTHNPLPLTGSHPPRPKSSSLIFLQSSLAIVDEPSLSYVPYFGDGDNEDIYSELFDTKERERLYEFGEGYREEEIFGVLDGILKELHAMKEGSVGGVSGLGGLGELLVCRELFEEVVKRSTINGVCDEKEGKCHNEGADKTEDYSGKCDNSKKKKMNKQKKKSGLKWHGDCDSDNKKQSWQQSDIETLERIHHSLAEMMGVDLVRVHERHSHCFFEQEQNEDTSNDKTLSTSEGDGSKTGSEEELSSNHFKTSITTGSTTSTSAASTSSTTTASNHKNNSDTKVVVPYPSIMDSYRDLFCRRCFTYDCNLHGNLPKADLDLLGELAVQKEREGGWKEVDKDIDVGTRTNKGKLKDDKDEQLTPAQQSICQRAYIIFQGDIEKVSHALGTTPSAIDAYVKSNNIQLQPNKFITTQQSSTKRSKSKYTSMKNYNPKWLRHIQSKVIHPAFLPCDHNGPCNDTNCSCVANGFFCTKHCGWGSKSPNFFRGCECRAGQCRAKSCPCYAAKRECDPDLCRTCGACGDPPGAPATGGNDNGQRCRNDNISMRRQAHTLIAESSIKEAGWGLFTKHSLKKGDFVIEYVGEQISQEEAERRGVIYDKMNMSYLFNLSSDLVVDATRKGNKARYANHSSTPNIEPKMVHVNGDIRIGFFAKQDIDAQSELFFDYRYDDQMDNELIFKPDHSVNFDWMKKKNNQGKKK